MRYPDRSNLRTYRKASVFLWGLLFLALSSTAEAASWKTPQVVSKNTTDTRARYTGFNFAKNIVVSNSGAVAVVWTDLREGTAPGTPRVYYNYTLGNYNDWQSADIAFGAVNSALPCIAYSSHNGQDNFYVFYEFVGGASESDIGYRIAKNGGGFAPHAVLTQDGNDGPNQNSCSVSSTGAMAHVVWVQDTTASDAEVFATHTNNQGSTFVNTQQVSDSLLTENSYTPSVAMNSAGLVFVGWTDNEIDPSPGTNEEEFFNIYNSTSAAGGDVRLSYSSNKNSWAPSTIFNKDRFHVTFQDSSGGPNNFNFEVFYWDSTRSVNNFTLISTTTNDFSDSSERPSIAGSGDNLYIFWHEGSEPNRTIKYRKSTNNGSTWGSIQGITDLPPGDNVRPHVAVGTDGKIHVIYTNTTGQPPVQKIYYSRYE